MKRAATKTGRKQTPRNRELGLIHILKAKLGLVEEQYRVEELYRAVLWAQGRVESSADLDDHGRRKVIAHLQSHLDARDKRFPGRPHNVEARHRAELQKIEALITDAGLPWSYAEAVMRRQTRGGKARLEWCDKGELAGIIAALERVALKRLSADLEKEFGPGWALHAEGYAALLFGFPAGRQIERYTEPMSKVLRWWRGTLPAACVWPVDVDKPACCVACYERAIARSRSA